MAAVLLSLLATGCSVTIDPEGENEGRDKANLDEWCEGWCKEGVTCLWDWECSGELVCRPEFEGVDLGRDRCRQKGTENQACRKDSDCEDGLDCGIQGGPFPRCLQPKGTLEGPNSGSAEENAPYCGDGACESSINESCKSCPADCGSCPQNQPAEQPPQGQPASSSCEGICGGQAPSGCSCNPLCIFNDSTCCNDVISVCVF
jgi:hypothetical protein